MPVTLTTKQKKSKFLELSSALTGFEASEIQGTGLVELYYRTLTEILGHKIFNTFITGISLDPKDEIKEVWVPICDNIVKMWYLGKWVQIDLSQQNIAVELKCDTAHPGNTTRVLGPAAYRESLVWKIISSNPPGAKQPGFSSWSVQP